MYTKDDEKSSVKEIKAVLDKFVDDTEVITESLDEFQISHDDTNGLAQEIWDDFIYPILDDIEDIKTAIERILE